MKTLLILILVLIPSVATAQEGSILYDYSVKFDYKIPEAWAAFSDQIPTRSNASMVLLFNGAESLMKVAPLSEEEAVVKAAAVKAGLSARAIGAAARLKMGSASRKDQETQLGVYVNQDEGVSIESMDFMGRAFLISGELPEYEWKLTGDQSEFLGFTVQKATAVQDSSSIEAWYTSEIPASGGPGLFGGLPGMILTVSIDEGQIAYSATEVKLDGLGDEVIEVPTEGDEISREDYEQIVVEKLDEIKRLRSRRGDRR